MRYCVQYDLLLISDSTNLLLKTAFWALNSQPVYCVSRYLSTTNRVYHQALHLSYCFLLLLRYTNTVPYVMIDGEVQLCLSKGSTICRTVWDSRYTMLKLLYPHRQRDPSTPWEFNVHSLKRGLLDHDRLDRNPSKQLPGLQEELPPPYYPIWNIHSMPKLSYCSSLWFSSRRTHTQLY